MRGRRPGYEGLIRLEYGHDARKGKGDTMNRTACGFIAVLTLAGLMLPTPAYAADDGPRLLTTEDIYNLVAQQLEATVKGSDQWSALPPVVSDVYASPSQAPCFVMNAYPPEKIGS